MVGSAGKVVVIVVAAGVTSALLAAACVFLAIWLYRRRASVVAGTRTRSLESTTATLRAGSVGFDSSVSISVASQSVADWGQHPLPAAKRAAFWGWRGGNNGRDAPQLLSVSGIPQYHYKYGVYLHYSDCNFGVDALMMLSCPVSSM